ncbi:hypothetical protein CVT24_009104 [Panaeolus cyanescens]|uniref:Uncharacterized protein n=1 Tax=Panaeolus cyanescens TaxID=181874 RepID=A0A409W3S4_9AGAR|nr:hypothetical protein CVT24_009104 [Panaeolus cyanescens]
MHDSEKASSTAYPSAKPSLIPKPQYLEPRVPIQARIALPLTPPSLPRPSVAAKKRAPSSKFRPRSLNSLFSGYGYGYGNRSNSQPPTPGTESAKGNNSNWWGKRWSTSKSRLDTRDNRGATTSIPMDPIMEADRNIQPPIPSITLNGSPYFDPFADPPPSYPGSSIIADQNGTFPTSSLTSPNPSTNPFRNIADRQS